MLIVIGTARSAPGRREELVAAVRRMTEASRRDTGCRSYGFYADLTDPDTIVGVEVWDSQDVLDAHMGHPHTQDFLAQAPALVASEPTMTIHRVTDDQD